MSSNNDNIEGQPPAKRQRRSLGASDRVVLDVGGTKFITSSSTLTSNSAYFAALLSDNWLESNNGEDDEIFIDQDAAPFSVLLAYMRRGNVKVEDINTDVLSLAEFLGLERLLVAVKVRWYCNIGKGPVHTTDDEIAVAFDQEHGGIMRAISSGLFRYFLNPNDVDAEKEFATLRFSVEAPTPGATPRRVWKLKEAGKPDPEKAAVGITAALSGLHLKGYTHYESQLKSKDTSTFSRRKHVTTMSSGGVTDIFIPNDDEAVEQGRNGRVKQFASVLKDEHDTIRGIGAPAEFHEDESIRSNPLNCTLISRARDACMWLEDNGFVTRENEYEDIFSRHMSSQTSDKKLSLFSRMIVHERGDESW